MLTEIRPTTDEDLPDLLPLLLGYSMFYRATPAEDDLVAMARGFCGESTGGRQLLARAESGEPVGFATVLWSWDTTTGRRLAVMEDLFVTPRARGSGVGRSLLGACATLARGRGCATLAWETAPDNARAQVLYDATGAERTSWLGYRLPLDDARPPATG